MTSDLRDVRTSPSSTFEFAPHNCFACGTLNTGGLGLTMHVEPGRSWIETTLDRRFEGWEGMAHGGILCTLADSAMGMAFASTLGEGETFTTLEIKVNYLRPVFEEKLFASAKVIHRGRTVGLVECDVTTENGKLVARAVSTCSVLRGEKAEGR